MKKDRRKFENPTKFIVKDVDNKVKCKCGCTVEFWNSDTKKLCQWCQNYVFRTPKDEFKFRLEQRLKNARK
jgi:hypothetical protein